MRTVLRRCIVVVALAWGLAAPAAAQSLAFMDSFIVPLARPLVLLEPIALDPDTATRENAIFAKAEDALAFSAMQATLRPGILPWQSSLVAASADETKGVAVNVDECQHHAVVVTWNTGTVSGGIQVETSDEQNFTGTWAPLGAEVAFAGTAPIKTTINWPGKYAWVRVRINTILAGDRKSVV